MESRRLVGVELRLIRGAVCHTLWISLWNIVGTDELL